MTIGHIKAKDFKGFQTIDLDLQGKSTVFFGINGTGKSTMLSIINYLFWAWINKLNPSQGIAYRSLDADLVRVGASELSLSADVIMEGEAYTLSRQYYKAKPGKSAVSVTNRKQYDVFSERFNENYLTDDANMPVFVNYGTNRSVLDIPLRIRNKHEFSKITALERAIENELDFRTFFEWYRNQEDLENEQKTERNDLEYEDITLRCVRTAVSAMLGNVSSLRVRRSPLRMVVMKDGLEFRVDQLSDGEKCTLALLGDLARRMALANPSLTNPLEGAGIVLIDEIELHMHPTWQRIVPGVLRNTFPHIQFMITTHSPQVLSELDDRYIIFRLISNALVGNSVERIERLDGYSSNFILEEYMETTSQNPKYKALLDQTYDAIRRNAFNEAEELLDQVRCISGDNSPDVIQLEAAQRRGMFLYEKGRKG